MTVGSDYADDLKHELLTEMADNFFSRRRRLDERLEGFAALRDRVGRQGALVLAHWRAFRALLLGNGEADRFLAGLGFDLMALAAFPDMPEARCSLRRPLALTGASRYRKAVLAFYDRLRREIVDYNEGGYAPDPRDPRRMRRVSGYDNLLDVARGLNKEIEAVNACQCPTDMIRFTKSLDPARQEQERACGGIALGNDACGLDKDLAFALLDLDALGVPKLPTPPPLEAIEADLSALADRIYASDPQAAKAALDSLCG